MAKGQGADHIVVGLNHPPGAEGNDLSRCRIRWRQVDPQSPQAQGFIPPGTGQNDFLCRGV